VLEEELEGGVQDLRPTALRPEMGGPLSVVLGLAGMACSAACVLCGLTAP
jgi:hypothetical protein